MGNKKNYVDPIYVIKNYKNQKGIPVSPTDRLNQTFGKIDNEREKEKRKEPQDSENSHSRNQ